MLGAHVNKPEVRYALPAFEFWSGKRDLNPRFNSLITQQFLLLIVPRRTALCTNSSRLATPSRHFLRHRLCPAQRRRRSADPSRIAKDQLARVAGLDPMRTTRSMKRDNCSDGVALERSKNVVTARLRSAKGRTTTSG